MQRNLAKYQFGGFAKNDAEGEIDKDAGDNAPRHAGTNT